MSKSQKKNSYLKNFENAKKAYLRDLSYRDVSEKTLSNYSKRLDYFYGFWCEKYDYHPTENPNPSDVTDWRNELLDSGKKKSTVRQYLVELKAFFDATTDSYYEDLYFFENNPVRARMFPRQTADEKNGYSHLLDIEDYEKLWANEKPASLTEKQWAKDYAIVTLLIDSKIRNQELRFLKLSDIDFEHKELFVSNGKGRKQRWVSLSDISLSAIKLYLDSDSRPSYLTDDDYLFGSTYRYESHEKQDEQWHALSSAGLSSIVCNHIKRVTGKDGFRTHSLRHFGAQLNLNQGDSLERIQSELGHSNINTTQLYTDRLRSRRYCEDINDVIEKREYWAMKNYEMLKRKEVC